MLRVCEVPPDFEEKVFIDWRIRTLSVSTVRLQYVIKICIPKTV